MCPRDALRLIQQVFKRVPAHPACNESYSHAESKFRDFLAIAGGSTEIPQTVGAWHAMRRNFARNDLSPRPNKDFARVRSAISVQPLFVGSSSIYLGHAAVITAPDGLEQERVLLKLARGLHYLHSPSPDFRIVPQGYQMVADFVEAPTDPVVWEMLPIYGNAGDFFEFRGGYSDADPRTSMWYMRFYKRLLAVASFIDRTIYADRSYNLP